LRLAPRRLRGGAGRGGGLSAKAEATLQRIGWAGVAARSAGTLSHGEQRQLEIAMALAGAPKVLLLDEPLAGMGPEESERMTALLKGLAREHALLLIEHDMDFVFAVADWMTVMVEGSVLAEERRAGGGTPGGDPREYGRAGGLPRGARVMPADPSAPLLEGRELDTYYGQSHIMRRVSLAIGAGETIGLMGRNGMGKTTLIRTLVG